MTSMLKLIRSFSGTGSWHLTVPGAASYIDNKKLKTI